jgi:hypothetical protein
VGRGVAGSGPAGPEVGERLAAIEERLAAIERALAARHEG